MRFLFVTNNYPPYARGGYEMWCRDVAEELDRRGHEMRVLTSFPSRADGRRDNDPFQIERRLAPEVDPDRGIMHTALRLIKDRERLEQESLSAVRDTIADFQPDAALIWGMWNIPRSAPALVEQLLPRRVAYYLCDYWPTLPDAYVQRWQNPSRRWWTQLPKRILGMLVARRLRDAPRATLELHRPICVSRAVRDLITESGVDISHARVIYGGTRTEAFEAARSERVPAAQGLRLLYVGRLEQIKGVGTAIEAMACVPPELAVRLSIYGHGTAYYEHELRTMVSRAGLTDAVSFRGLVSADEIATVMGQHDVLLFTSEWQEPFARTVLEAMAAGLVVVGTTTGGTGEILHDGETGLTFTAGSADELATKVARLAQDPALARRLAQTGHDMVLERFTLRRMVDEIEAELVRLNARNG